MEYPIEVINLARITNLALTSKNHLEKFLLQQNLIQYNLALLIFIRSKLPDNKLLEWIENKTLGELMQLYKICGDREEDSFLKDLGNYNKQRKYLVHGIFKGNDFNKIEIEANNANVKGTKIINKLNELFRKEINKAQK